MTLIARLATKALGPMLAVSVLAACSQQELKSLADTSNVSASDTEDDGMDPLGQCRAPRDAGGKVGLSAQGPFDSQASKILLSQPEAQIKNLAEPRQRDLTVTINRDCQNSTVSTQSISKSFSSETGPHIESYGVQVKEDEDFSVFLEHLESDPCVLYVGDASVSHTYAMDPGLNQQLHMQAIGATAVMGQIHSQQMGVTEDVVVAIIDTGIQSSHPDLRDNMWTNMGEIAGNGRDDDNNGYVDDINGYNFADRNGRQDPTESRQNHGTHVAGLTGAGYDNGVGGSGVLGQHVKLMGLNVFGSSNGASNSSIENAIRYAADNGADVINMSLGGCGYTATTGQAISYAIEKGIVVVVAAGNSTKQLSSNPQDGRNCNTGGAVFDTPGSFGASFSGMLTVGSVEATNIGSRSSFSNYGAQVLKLMAPGSESTPQNRGLYSTDVGGGYVRLIGTSMASPVAAGAAAVAVGLIRSRNYQYTPKDIEDLLVESAKTYSSLSQFVSGGRSLDVANLVNLVNDRYPAQATPPVDPPVDPPVVVDPPVDPPVVVDPPVDPPAQPRPCRPRPGRPGRR